MGELKTRKPTGKAPYPFVLVEGLAKSGKGWSWATLSASERVGRTVAIITGERDGDEYAKIPGADYEIAVHDGTYQQIRSRVQEACEELSADDEGRPPVVVVDSATNIWTLLKNEAQQKAFRRAVENAKKYGKQPPSDEEEASIHMDLWNWAKKRWRKIVDPLMKFEGISVVTARGKEIAEVDDRPTGATKWKVDAEKSLVYDVDVWIRTLAPGRAKLIGARSVKRGIKPDTTRKLPENWSLDHVIFEMLECGGGDVDYQPMQEDPDDLRHRWEEADAELDTLIEECGLNGDVKAAVRRELLKQREADSWDNVHPDYIEKVVDRLGSLSTGDQPNGAMSPRMARILDVTGMSPDEATAGASISDDEIPF